MEILENIEADAFKVAEVLDGGELRDFALILATLRQAIEGKNISESGQDACCLLLKDLLNRGQASEIKRAHRLLDKELAEQEKRSEWAKAELEKIKKEKEKESK